MGDKSIILDDEFLERFKKIDNLADIILELLYGGESLPEEGVYIIKGYEIKIEYEDIKAIIHVKSTDTENQKYYVMSNLDRKDLTFF